MAELLEPTGRTQPARASYPWDEWLDGRPRRLTMSYPDKPGDFAPEPRVFRTYAYRAAAKRGRRLVVQLEPAGVIMQAYEPGQPRPVLPVWYAHAANGKRSPHAPPLSTLDTEAEAPTCRHCSALLTQAGKAHGECRSAIDPAWRCTSGEPRPARKRPGS